MDRPPPSTGRYRIEALAKGLHVLRTFDGSQEALRVSEIAARTGIPLPTTFRIVATLEELGYVERRGDGSVRPGLAVLTLGTAALRSSTLLQVSDRPLHHLADITGETVNLGVLTDDRVLYIARLRNSDLVTADLHVGSTLPAVYASMGKVLLAHLAPKELRHRISARSFARPAGPNAVPDLAALQAQLLEIRTCGYAVQDEEVAAGLRSISVPVPGADQTPLAALNVAVSTTRYSAGELAQSFVEPLRKAAEEIALRLRQT